MFGSNCTEQEWWCLDPEPKIIICHSLKLVLVPEERSNFSRERWTPFARHTHTEPVRPAVFSLHLLKLHFVCGYRTQWRTARLRSRPTTLSFWRTCRTPSARWKNRLPPFTAFSAFHLQILRCRITFHLVVFPESYVLPRALLFVLTVCVFSCGRKRERCTVFIICCLMLASSGSSACRWSCMCVDLKCVWKTDLFLHPFFLSVYMIYVCVCVALAEGVYSVDVL